ncbi:MAG: M1 family metallopeptidase [Ginsengibacter sp.]
MKDYSVKKLFVFLLVYCPITVFCQSGSNYFQQEVNYKIDVTLNDVDKTLDGFETIDYTNRSPDTLFYIWFHLWPNAYKNDRTAFSEQLLQLGRTDFYFSEEEQRGYINRLDFKVNNISAQLENHNLYIDVAKLILPSPIAPGETIKITTPFHVKIPFNFSRGGYVDDTYQVTQWYPKPAVYDNKGWHPMPYLDQGEFYSEFGNYTVDISFPSKYKVAATGKLQNTKTNNSRSTTHTYVQNNVHDFAWFANKDFIVKEDTLRLASGRIIEVKAYYTPEGKQVWKKSISFLKDAITTRSKWLGEYPYDVVSAVEATMGFDGGMEYPTITSISPMPDEQSLDLVIEHEVGHNWNYGILATNERDHPWMDEGINTYFDNRYTQLKYGTEITAAKGFIEKKLPEDPFNFAYRIAIAEKKDQPIETKAADFSPANSAVIAYYKTGLWMQKIETYLGKNLFDSCLHEYYNRWKFKHPYPEDFKKIIEDVSLTNMDSLFSLLNKKGPLEIPDKKKIKIDALFNFSKTDKYNYFFLSPAIGLNYYDKLMIGGLIHNYTLTEPRFHFFAAPMYSTGSKSFTGMARAGYNFMSYGLIRKAELSISGAKFTMDDFTDSTGTKKYMGFTKLVPSAKLIFRNKNAISQVVKYVQWKTYFIEETSLSFYRDSVSQQDVLTFPKTKRYLNQLVFSFENNRALYPYSAKLVTEQGKDFMRLALDGNYFFNYAKGGGLSARIFAGKFLYLGDRTIYKRFATDRYHLNMTGANGYEDYTYSNYFVGRNEFEGASSQQIMIRDGGFKVRTDLLSSKIGKTDDWLVAANFQTDFPKKLDPLQMLPVKIPLKIFLDIGTYAEAWKKDATSGKFIYDAGLQLSLLKDLVNIYIPILYSKVYGNYFKSTIPANKRFLQNISFSIDIQKFNLNKFLNLQGY